MDGRCGARAGDGCGPGVGASPSAKLRLLTEGARSFGSDGVRYVVYVHRLPGERGSARPLMIVDTAKGVSRRSVRLPAGCIVGPAPVAMTRGFLLACSGPGETVLVDLAHGSLVRVPSWFDVGGVPQLAEFATIGRQWLQGTVACPGGFGQCVAYENWHTGEQRSEGLLGVARRDLDDPALGLARACAPFERVEYFQSDGRYVLLNPHRENLALGRCGHEGLRLLDPIGSGADQTLSAGFVTWTNGSCVHAVLGYDLKQRRTTRWAVPHIPGKSSCGAVMHTAKAVIVGSSLTGLVTENTYRLYITRRP
jgi:hypothetical protein